MFTKEDFQEWLQLSYSEQHSPEDAKEKTKRLQELNVHMTEMYPFLLPHNRFTDEVSDDYNYMYNEWSAISYGWQKAFGWKLLNELNDALLKIPPLKEYEHSVPDNRAVALFRITEIKDKYGTLRIYSQWSNDEIEEIFNKYLERSKQYCIYCGNPVTIKTEGWIEYICDDCAKKMKDVITLNAEDAERLQKELDNPSEPNNNLKELMKGKDNNESNK